MLKHRLAMAVVAMMMGLGALMTASTAQAGGLLLGLDAGASMSLSEGRQAGAQPNALGLRLGYEMPVPGVRIIPEGQLSLTRFDIPDGFETTEELRLARVGLKIGMGGPISPAIYGHIGYATHIRESLDFQERTSGTSYDLGVAIDMTLLPMVNLGLHAGVNTLQGEPGDEPERWLDAGAHLEVVF